MPDPTNVFCWHGAANSQQASWGHLGVCGFDYERQSGGESTEFDQKYCKNNEKQSWELSAEWAKNKSNSEFLIGVEIEETALSVQLKMLWLWKLKQECRGVNL